ncbi:MAG: hypothetical protein Q7R70_04150 [Candidatus Diapherotrites archaeon]|nr:hypothetical protein [Candidatus Diapherotrites archaeon]
MTLAIPESLHKVMKKHSEVKWTEVARKAIESKAKELELDNKAWRNYALKHALEDWTDADELIKY